MRMTVKNIIKLLKAIRVSKKDMAKIYAKNENFAWALEYETTAKALDAVIFTLEHEKHFKAQCEIYEVEDGE